MSPLVKRADLVWQTTKRHHVEMERSNDAAWQTAKGLSTAAGSSHREVKAEASPFFRIRVFRKEHLSWQTKFQ